MLSFDYTMELDFGNAAIEGPFGTQPDPQSSLAREHAFTLRCLPQELPCQHVLDSQVLIEPETELTYQTDAFGNRYCYGLIHQPHAVFRVQVKGRAERYPERRETASIAGLCMYRSQSANTRPGPHIDQLYRDLQQEHSEQEDDLALAVRIRDLVHDTIAYTPGATFYDTTAEQAAKGGKGVCQDLSHIMLSLCRMFGIPCRYTAGLLLGEGRSHAWVEVCYNGSWYPMDPTNPRIAWNEQIIFSHGRDAVDCKINRGTYIGPSAQMQFVTAAVEKE